MRSRAERSEPATQALQELAHEKAEQQEDLLVSLELAMQARLQTIEANQIERERLAEFVKQRRAEIRSYHQNANRLLVELVDQAQASGIEKRVICARLGVSSQNLLAMKRAVAAWDREEQ